MKPARVVRLLLHSAFCLLPSLCLGYGNLQFRDATGTNMVNSLWDERSYNSTNFPNGIPWLLNDQGTKGAVSNLTLTELSVIVSNAFETWEAVPESKIAFTFGAFTTNGSGSGDGHGLPPNPALDGDNVIVFDNLPSGALGLTFLFTLNDQFTFTSTNNSFGGTDAAPDIPEGTYPAGTILDADIMLSTNANWSVTGEYGKTDLQAVLVHEIGHFIGLCHSVVGAPYPAVMFPFAESNPDGLSGRDLKADDKAGVAAYYPSPTFSTTFGSISGQVIRQDNSNAVPSAHVVATLSDDPSQVISVYSTLAGGYRIDGLLAGGYILRVEPLPKASMGYHAGSAINDVVSGSHDLDFLPRIYPNVMRDADATLVGVTAGSDSSNRTVRVLDGDVADAFEDDDTVAQARTLATDGKKEFHNVVPAGDVDCFKFTALAGKEYLIRTTDYGTSEYGYGNSGGAWIEVADLDGRVLFVQRETGLDSWLSFVSASNGVYYVSIKHAMASMVISPVGGSGTHYAVSVQERVPTIYYVSADTGDDVTGNGTAANPWKTIGRALTNRPATAINPVSIYAAAGIYPEHIILPSHSSLCGGFNPSNWVRNPSLNPTLLDGSATGTVVTTSYDTRLDGLTIQNGEHGIDAVGQRFEGSSPNPIVADCLVRSNSTAIYLVTPTAPILLRNLITANTSRGVGVGDSFPLILQNQIIGNGPAPGDPQNGQGGAGIGIFQNLYYFAVEVAGNEIAGNRANYAGGGIWCNGVPNEIFQQNVIVGNSAVRGGGIYLEATLTRSIIQDNVIAGNTAQQGGGIFIQEGQPTIEGNTY